MMTQREVIAAVLRGERPPYVPWCVYFTKEAWATLCEHYGADRLEGVLQNHIIDFGECINYCECLPNDRVRDVFGVVWDRSVDKDIGVVETLVLPEPTLANYTFPDPFDGRFFDHIPSTIARRPDCFRLFRIGFSLYERAWTMRGMQNLMMDFYDHPEFVRELLDRIADYNIAQVHKALEDDIDAVYFGDDWGQQSGLQMGIGLWREFIKPVLKRTYEEVHKGGKFVFIHSCGDVDELFDDLIEIGVDCFNPFQPEVMDTYSLLDTYRGRLTFFGGMSTQQILPFGTVPDVRVETRRLINAGRAGSYIFSAAHAVESDVPLENMIAFIEEVQDQPGFTPC